MNTTKGDGPERPTDTLLKLDPDVTGILNQGLTTVKQLVLSGRLPVIRIGRSVRVKRSDLQAFIESL
jgi:excisionase family DNA binding protein